MTKSTYLFRGYAGQIGLKKFLNPLGQFLVLVRAVVALVCKTHDAVVRLASNGAAHTLRSEKVASRSDKIRGHHGEKHLTCAHRPLCARVALPQ